MSDEYRRVFSMDTERVLTLERENANLRAQLATAQSEAMALDKDLSEERAKLIGLAWALGTVTVVKRPEPVPAMHAHAKAWEHAIIAAGGVVV